MAKARKHTLVAEQGSDWSFTVKYEDSAGAAISLAGYSATMQIRDREEGSVLMELTNTNNRIVLGGAAGTVTLKLTGAELLSFAASDHADPHVYDLVLTSSGGNKYRILYGKFVNERAITR